MPWYWFQRVLPELGDDLGMLYLMCKNCCYVDWARGRTETPLGSRRFVHTSGWIRSETLPKRIPHAKPSKRGRPKSAEVSSDSAYVRKWRQTNRNLASQYLCRLDTRISNTGTDWQLQVSEVQLTAADESLNRLYTRFSSPHPILSVHKCSVSMPPMRPGSACCSRML